MSNLVETSTAATKRLQEECSDLQYMLLLDATSDSEGENAIKPRKRSKPQKRRQCASSRLLGVDRPSVNHPLRAKRHTDCYREQLEAKTREHQYAFEQLSLAKYVLCGLFDRR